MNEMNMSRTGLLGSMLTLMVSQACLLNEAKLEDGEDEAGESEGAELESSEGDNTDPSHETGAQDPDGCLSFGTNLESGTEPPEWALFPGYDVTCASGFGHEDVRLESIAWTITVDMGRPEIEDPLVAALADGGAVVLVRVDGSSMLVRFTAAGEKVWTKTLGSLGSMFATEMISDANDRIFIGASDVAGAALFAFDASGAELWSHGFVGETFGGIAKTDAGVVLTLLSESSTRIAVSDPAGIELWSTTSSTVMGWHVAQLPDGDYLVGSYEGWSRHDGEGSEIAAEPWPFDVVSVTGLVVSEGRLFVVGTAHEDGSESPYQLLLARLDGSDESEDLALNGTWHYNRATSWVPEGDGFDPGTATYESGLALVAVPQGVVALGVENAGGMDIWQPWLVRVDEQGGVLGIDRGFWSAGSLAAAAGPNDTLFLVTGNDIDPTQFHLRKYELE